MLLSKVVRLILEGSARVMAEMSHHPICRHHELRFWLGCADMEINAGRVVVNHMCWTAKASPPNKCSDISYTAYTCIFVQACVYAGSFLSPTATGWIMLSDPFL